MARIEDIENCGLRLVFDEAGLPLKLVDQHGLDFNLPKPSSAHVDEHKAFPDQTSTEVAPTVVNAEVFTQVAEPASDSAAIYVTRVGKAVYRGLANLLSAGGGHMVGLLAWFVMDAPGRTVGLGIAGETKIEVLNGTATTAVGAENQLTQNNGAIGTLILTDNQVVSNAGSIGTCVGVRNAITDNDGTIGTWIANYTPDHSTIAPGALRYSHKSDDPGAIMLNKGAVVDGGTYATSPTTGQTVTIPFGYSTAVIIPDGTLASLTIAFPTKAALDAAGADGYEVQIKTTATLTSLTLSSTGAAFLDAVTTLAALGYVKYRYIQSSSLWYRIG